MHIKNYQKFIFSSIVKVQLNFNNGVGKVRNLEPMPTNLAF